MQRAIEAPALDGEGRVARQPVLEREGADALEELVKAPRREGPELEQDTLGEAGAEVGPREAVYVRLEKNAPVLRRDSLHAHVPQLVAQRPLEAEKAARRQLQTHKNPTNFQRIINVFSIL